MRNVCAPFCSERQTRRATLVRGKRARLMARRPRLVVPGVPVHLIQRGNNRSRTFYSVGDFECYRDVLYHASQRFRCAIHTYVFNPVRARMVETPARYRWSSHRHNAFGDSDPLVTLHPSYEALGLTSAARQAAYQGLFDTPIEPSTLDRIRRDTNRGAVLGDEPFLDRLANTLERDVRLRPHGGDGRSAAFQQL